MNDESDRNKQPNLNQDSLNKGMTGWLWVKQGFEIFRKQPAEMLSTFFGYLFLVLTLTVIPLLGQIAYIVLIPTLVMGFMQACHKTQKNERVNFLILFDGFRSPAFSRLLLLGAFHFFAALIAASVFLFVVDDVVLEALKTQQKIDISVIAKSNIAIAMLLAMLAYLPAQMAFWYAGPLIMWNGMSVGKAMFYSFVAVKRMWRAFLGFGASWVLIIIFFQLLASLLVALFSGDQFFVMIIITPVFFALTTVIFCSFYPNYINVFGTPDHSVIMNEDE